MEPDRRDGWQIFKRLLIGMIKARLMIALVFFGIIVFGVAVETLDPVKAPLPTFGSVQAELEERARAQREGRAPDLERFRRPFDNFHVTGYLIPLSGIWILVKFARWRRRLPAAVFATLLGLGLVWWLLWTGAEALYDLYLSFDTGGQISGKVRGQSWLFIAVMVLLVPVLSIRWLRRGPGWLDRMLRASDGVPRGPQTVTVVNHRARTRLFVSSLALAPPLWWLYDWFDGTATPGPFALSVRAGFVLLALWLLARPQIDLAWPSPGATAAEAPEPAVDDLIADL